MGPLQAKAALMRQLADLTGPNQTLAGVDVFVNVPRDMPRTALWAGLIRFTRDQLTAEAPVVGVGQTLIDLVIRVARVDVDGSDADDTAGQIFDAVRAHLDTNPRLVGARTWAGVTGGRVDHAVSEDDRVTTITAQISIAGLTA